MHRDVKMQNILLKDNNKTLILTDYGTATNFGRSSLSSGVGTAITRAPEVFTGTTYTEQCDIYSWSIVLWQLLSKQPEPYEGVKTEIDIYRKVVEKNIRPRKLNHCPDVLVALMDHSWHSDPNKRPTLLFIKETLRFLLNLLSKSECEYSKEAGDGEQTQCTDEPNSLEQYLPDKPLLNNEISMNIYKEHFKKLNSIWSRQQDIPILKQNQSKCDHHEDLLEENKKLREQIDKLREQHDHHDELLLEENKKLREQIDKLQEQVNELSSK